MKKVVAFISVFSFCFLLHAQNSVPNGNFESWTLFSFSYPTNYEFNSNREDDGEISISKTVGYTGNFGVEIKTLPGDNPETSYMLNNNVEDNNPAMWHGGIPYAQKPLGIQGYYKYNVATADSGMIIIVFSKNGVNIGTYIHNIGGEHTSYTPFNFTFSPALSLTPDSVIIAFASSGFNTAQGGSSLILDNISFTGVYSQPELVNGDFEQWTDITIETPEKWNIINGSASVKKTSDAFKGQYAAELITSPAEDKDDKPARPAQIMTGYYPDCDGNCYPIGGYPFDKQEDVLEFYYKYTPSGNDFASVSLYFKKSGNGMDGWYAGTNLYATSGYSYAEIPFNLPFVPDSVIIQFQSSKWETISIENIGSTLKIDEVCFRSQKNNPNHSSNTIVLKSDSTVFGAGIGAGCTTSEMYSILNSTSSIETLNFVNVDVDDAGTWTNIPPNSPEGTSVININPSDGQNGFFKLIFTLPEDFINPVLTGVANIDDRGRAFLNGTPITPEIESDLAITQFGNVAFETHNPQLFKPGENIINLSDANNGCGPSGAAFYFYIYYDLPSGIKIMNNKTTHIYPNPTENGFYIEKDLKVLKVSITDLSGMEVVSILNNTNYMDVSNLQNGLYLVVLKTENGIYQSKIIKK